MSLVKLKYIGISKKRATWSSMDKTYSYNLIPGKVLELPEEQVSIISGFGSFQKIKTVETMIETESTEVITPEDEAVFKEQEVNIPEVQYENEPTIDGQGPSNEVIEEVEEDDFEETPEVDYMALTKAELKKLCRERGLTSH